MESLVLCPSCRRHVKGAADACPFCRGAMPARSAAVLAGAAVVGRALSLAACSIAITGTGGGGSTGSGGATTSSSGVGGFLPAYGLPPPDGGTGGQGGMISGAYGPPPPVDAGPMVDAAYGPPPHPDLP
jgi:hypothetical protein